MISFFFSLPLAMFFWIDPKEAEPVYIDFHSLRIINKSKNRLQEEFFLMWEWEKLFRE